MDLLLGLLAKTLNMPMDDIKSLINKEDSDELKDDALAILLKLDADRITDIKANHKTDKDDQHKRATKEVSLDWEKRIKSQFNLDSELEGDELLASAFNSVSDGSGDGELTDEKVKAHALFIALQNSKKADIDGLNKEWQDKLDAAGNDFNAKATRTNVNQSALSYIKSKKPVLPEDHAKANKRLNAVLPELDKYDYELKGDTYIVKNKDGSQLMDSHNNPVSFNDLVDSIGEDYFDFDDSVDGGNGNSGTGNNNKFGDNKPFDKTKVPQNHEELQHALKSAKTTEDRASISKAYLDAQNNTD